MLIRGAYDEINKMTLARFLAKKLSEEEINELVHNIIADFSSAPGLRSILLFGSAANGTMTDASDIDVILIFDTKESSSRARKSVGSLRRKSAWPMDLLCVDIKTFQRKSKVGGIYFVAQNEGRVIFGEKP